MEAAMIEPEHLADIVEPLVPPDNHSSQKRESSKTTFNLVLHCEKTDATDHKELSFLPDPHTTIRDVKLEIERCHSIPTCVQVLSYESQVIGDNARLQACCIRGGDTIHVRYQSEGDCEKTLEIIRWLGLVLGALKLENPSVDNVNSDSLELLLMVGIENEYIENLAFEYFFPWLDTKKFVNKLHFVHNGGLDILMEVYSLLLRQPWSKILIKFKYLEYGLLRVLWNLSETFALRRLINRHGGLEMVMASLLRKTLEQGGSIHDEHSPSADWILVETIGAALGVLCNLSELPECHVAIASRTDVLLQLSCLSLSDSMRVMSAQLVVTLLLCLAYTPETHQYLSNPIILERVLRACQITRNFSHEEDEKMDTLMLSYFTQMFLSELALVSPHHIPPQFYPQIKDHMTSFLTEADPETIKRGEVRHWYVWSTFVPYVKLVYIPDTPEPPEMHTLKLLSLETVILGLRNMLARDNHREVLVREGLLDFILCLPSHVPEPLLPQAKALVQLVSSSEDLTVSPPSLANIVKAGLAKSSLGLEKVLQLSVGEIISELLSV